MFWDHAPPPPPQGFLRRRVSRRVSTLIMFIDHTQPPVVVVFAGLCRFLCYLLHLLHRMAAKRKKLGELLDLQSTCHSECDSE
jgi:hypothetical protein